jgi:hypothetical protein
VNTIIFKDIGSYRIHRLRVIHIYEADFNLLLAIKWRQLLRHADNRNLINPRLFGGRPGCEAQSLPFREELKYDICYVTRRTLINFDNDASSCYDRIIISLASLINSRSLVADKEAETPQASGYLYLKHSATHTWSLPMAPGLLAQMDVNKSRSQWWDSLMTAQARATTSVHRNKPTQIPSSNKWNTMHNHGMISSGAPEGNSNYQSVRFTRLRSLHPNGSTKPVLSQQKDHIKKLKDPTTGAIIPISSKSAIESHSTLGHWKAPADPKQSKQLKILISKMSNISTLIHIANLSRYGATTAYLGIYISSLKYVLPQCFFDDRTLQKAERKTIPLIVAKCGYNRTTAIALRYAPTHHAGCGFVRWQTLQGEGQIHLFMKHLRTDTIISQVLRIAISWCQWQSGLSTSILGNGYENATPTPLQQMDVFPPTLSPPHRCHPKTATPISHDTRTHIGHLYHGTRYLLQAF